MILSDYHVRQRVLKEDIGLDHGLRNKLAESWDKGENEKARYYISTTYAVIGIIGLIFFVGFFITNMFLDWTKILNTSPDLQNELSTLAIIVFGSFCLLPCARLDLCLWPLQKTVPQRHFQKIICSFKYYFFSPDTAPLVDSFRIRRSDQSVAV